MVDAKLRQNEKIRKNESIETNEFKGYPDTLALYKRKAKECPKGVRLKLQKQKHLMIQFLDPATDKITVRSSGEMFTDEGIINAVNKCWQISSALKRFENSGDFWNWYDTDILGKSVMIDNMLTYREIFQILEDTYFKGKHKNTKRKRSREIANDVSSFECVYGSVFNRFSNWYTYPSVQDFKDVIVTLSPGTKTFKNTGFTLKKIAELSHDSRRIIEYLAGIDFSQTVFSQKQSIDYQTFINWYIETKRKLVATKHRIHREQGLSWLWITGIGVVYGLRPSEIAAAKNLSVSHTVDSVTFKPITDPNNHEKLLYLDDFTYYGCSIKTGSRICKPLASQGVIDELGINDFPGLPSINSRNSRVFSSVYRDFLVNNNCPVTQAYAFRHLANQLGELNGIPQEIRSRSLGHSTTVNETVYKKRSNTKTTVDLLTGHSKQALPLDSTIRSLRNLGIDPDSPDIALVLSVVYQLTNPTK